MESFIVRIYHRSHTKPEDIAGLVETVGAEEKHVFQSFSTLISVLRNVVLRQENNPENADGHESCTIPDKKQAS